MKQEQLKDSFPHTPESFHLRVQQTLDGLQERKVIPMKSRKLTKKVLITAATIVVLATAIFAGTRAIQTNSHSSRENDFTELPSAQQMQKDYEFTARLTDDFANGFTFECGTPVSASTSDADGNTIQSYQQMQLIYALGDAEVSLFVDAAQVFEHDPNAETVQLGDVTAYYSSFAQKSVPPDYQPTEQELADVESGKLNIGYGADEISISQTNTLVWTQDGLNYVLLSFDNDADLQAMAQELIALPNP